VVEGEQVELGYVARNDAISRRAVHPLGLASKGSAWYLVADTTAGLRTFRVDRVTSVTPLGEPVVRPESFDLAEAWRTIMDEVDQRRLPVQVRATAAPEILWVLRTEFGNRVRIGPAGPDGRVQVELRGQHERGLAGELAGFGDLVEVHEPPGLRAELARLGAQLTARYGEPPAT
jgi:predicted DNA-binding transcriptional regulator YafY